MLKELFVKKQYATITVTKEQLSSNPVEYKTDKAILDDKSTQCSKCGNIITKEDLSINLFVCPECGFHYRIGAAKRIDYTFDRGSFREYDRNITSLNPLQYPGYEEKVKQASSSSGISEAVITGREKIDGHTVYAGIMDSNFIMGSMGSVVGEKLTWLIERAADKRLPVIVFCVSGGARMQEGILSLMQMAKVSAALNKLSDAGLPYISVLTDPTTGGVTASFAMLGDYILAEPGAQIGFAGKRVIEQTIRQKLPEGFQTSEFLLEHGFVDKIVARHEMKAAVSMLLKFHS
jgi:acetyl-CoA carboxylase carboxyl transferase subunit beta